MSIDKRFSPTDEPHDRQRARIDVLTGTVPSAERPSRTRGVADLEYGFPEAGAAPPNLAWQIRCEDCDPQRGGYYWFSLDQCDTPAKALDCIMQLNERRWSPIVMESFIALIEYLFGRGTMID
ncbi:MAG: hypothetical protein WB609_01160 [Candidatus Cybelea sp.]